MNHEETIFEQAVGIGSAQAREEFLRGACAGNDAMFERVQGLLRAHDRAGRFLEHVRPADGPFGVPPSGGGAAFGVPPSGGSGPGPAEAGTPNLLTEKPGDHIGRYKLLQKIGEGGCGVVYMAEQEEPVRRRVALKIIKLGMDTRQVIARFEAERQALALMDHPNIAKVFDAGVTEAPLTGSAGILPASREAEQRAGKMPALPVSAGRPYFVMELVRGVKITEYCDEKKLTTQQRLELFMQVCRAVQHAHQKGIIHRDLKPSNILVSLNDGVAVPKVIDFGIAKATTGEPLTDKTVFTAFEQFIGTPAYMSPEQALVTSLDIDTRTDIYALGVLLYELLTGHTPFDPKELLQAGLDEMRRTIREKEPARPSTRLTDLVVADIRRLTTSSEKDRASSRRLLQEKERLASQLRGDLDWIVMKCLEKDRARRYETANGLATDIQRHLNSEPVVACPPSKLYRFQKMVRRNKLAFTAGAGIGAALVIGLAIALWQFIEKSRAFEEQTRLRQQAQAEAFKSHQVAQFFEDTLAGAGPEIAKGRDATILKEILNKTAERVGTELTNQPAVKAYLLERLGKVYRDLGDYPTAESMEHLVLTLRRKLYPDGHRDLAEAMNNLAVTSMLLGHLPEAESFSREALDMGKKFPSPYPGDMAAWMNNLATILKRRTKFAEAEAMYREALALNRKTLGNEHREVAATLNNLALVLGAQDKEDQAEPLMREALEMNKKVFGDLHPLVARNLSSLTAVLQRLGKLQEAEKIGREAVAMQEKLHGREHPDVAIALGNLASVLLHKGDLPGAESLEQEALAIRRKKLGPAHPILAKSLHNLGNLLNQRGKLPEAETTLREALAMANKFPNNDYVAPTNILAELNKALTAQGKPSEAMPQTAPAESK